MHCYIILRGAFAFFCLFSTVFKDLQGIKQKNPSELYWIAYDIGERRFLLITNFLLTCEYIAAHQNLLMHPKIDRHLALPNPLPLPYPSTITPMYSPTLVEQIHDDTHATQTILGAIVVQFS